MITLSFPPKNKKEIARLLTVLNVYFSKHKRYPDCYCVKYDRKLMCFMNYEELGAGRVAKSNLSKIKNIDRAYMLNANLLVDYCAYCLNNNKMKSFNSYLHNIHISSYIKRLTWKTYQR